MQLISALELRWKAPMMIFFSVSVNSTTKKSLVQNKKSYLKSFIKVPKAWYSLDYLDLLIFLKY